MKTFITSSVLLLLGPLLSVHAALAGPIPSFRTLVSDSIGVEKKDGKRFILHRVDEGQTLYSLARKYGRSVAEIKAANPDLKASVQYNQVVRIPIPDGTLTRKEEKAVDKAIKNQKKEEKRAATTESKPDTKPVSAAPKPIVKAEKSNDKDPKKTDDPARAGIHVVESGQTLYSLAGRYGVSQSDLRKWNNLSNNNVLIGQALIVSEKAYQARTPSTPVPSPPVKTPEPATRPAVVHPAESHTPEPRATVPTAEPKSERHTEGDVVNKSPTPPAESHRPDHEVASRPSSTSAKTTEPEVEVEPPRPGNDAPMPTRGRRISASGVAEIIEGADGSGKYLALHRTAPIGTLVQVRNEFNNQSLWVKVIGRLPNTGVNDKILIKLSTQAFAKLSPEDRRFRAEVSYIVR